MMRRDALAMGAAVLAAAPVVVSPLPVVASSLPSWEQFRSLYDYNYNDPVIVALYGDPITGVWWRWYYSALYAVVEGVYINEAFEITPGDFAGINGYYLRDGVQRFGAMYGSGVYRAVTVPAGGSMTPINLVATQDGNLMFSIAPNSGGGMSYNIRPNINAGRMELNIQRADSGGLNSTMTFAGTGMFQTATLGTGSGHIITRYIMAGSGAPLEFTSTGDYIASNTSGRQLLGGALTISALPTSDVYPTITADNALDYVADVLNPYIVENAPDIEPYLFNPHEGEPIYPTGETVSGMPKEWTVENPALPSYNLDLQLPTADFQAVDVSTPLEQNASGIRFWWAMLGTLLDHFGLKSLVVLACALGLFLLVLTRLGR